MAFQAMAGMYKTGMLLTEGGELNQNSVSFSNRGAHRMPRKQKISAIHHAHTKTKRLVDDIRKLFRKADYQNTNEDVQVASVIEILTVSP